MSNEAKVKPTRRMSIQEQRERKVHSKMKFATIGEMRTQHNAIQTLFKNGYDTHALRQIAGQFQDSIEYVFDEVNSMRQNMSDVINA